MADPATTAPSTPAVSAANIPNPSIPVMINEAGLDSPSFRASAIHFADQIDAIEKWLDGYVKATAKLVHDMSALEETINNYLAKVVPPPSVTAADADYTALALKRVGDGSREWWTQILSNAKKLDSLTVDPIRRFLQDDLRIFRDSRRNLEQTQKSFDTTLSRYVSQSKTKEPSSLREDAFTVFETRKAYLKASMDFCYLAPQLRFTLDKLLVQVSSDMWRDMKRSRDAAAGFSKWGHEMDRIRGWSKDLSLTEPLFKRELQMARRDVAEATLAAFKPSRELEDYSASTVPFLGSNKGPLNVAKDKSAVISEKQGWLFLRTVTGKPVRTHWIRRWYYCREGIFGWLVSGPQGVLQGDEIGVLLCNVKPAVGEERRFCFEMKTKNQTLLLQAETQSQLMEWLEVFEVAKKRAFEASVRRDSASLPGGVDPAFSIMPPSIPEFSAKALESQTEDGAPALERAGTLALPGTDVGLVTRPSFDVNPDNKPKRAGTTLARDDGESGRDHAARIMQKLDLHRKANFSSSTDTTAAPSPAPPAGGIASLISASHNLLPGYPNPLAPMGTVKATPFPMLTGPEAQPGSLAPPTLAKPPALTSLSKSAVMYSSEKGLGTDSSRPLPTAIMANYWGSNSWGNDFGSRKTPNDLLNLDDPFAPIKIAAVKSDEEAKTPLSAHKKAISMDASLGRTVTKQGPPVQETFPPNYPVELRANAAQFRLLFPNVPMEEKLVLVIRAAWNSTVQDKSKLPQITGNGRIYVTPDSMYFYGHQLGLVVAYHLALDSISEVTAAPGKDCDFIFLHLAQPEGDEAEYTRITIKTFLEDLDLLHSRLNLLVDDLQAEEPMDTPELIRALINLEDRDDYYDKKSPSAESWEEVSVHSQSEDPMGRGREDFAYRSRSKMQKRQPKFQLPSHAVIFEPSDMQRKVAERHFEISAKACFHVLFGDKSFVFPKLYFDKRAKEIAQGPWITNEAGNKQRFFDFKVDYTSMLGGAKHSEVIDDQTIDIFNDHVTYVVSHVMTPWHLPHAQDFKLVSKIVITHVAKSKCKLAIFVKVAWSKAPTLGKTMIEKQALDDAAGDGEELAEVATDQVRKLGHHSRTKRAIQVYGNVGQQNQVVIFTPSEADLTKKPQVSPRTLGSMLFETVWSLAESAISSLMIWSFAALTKLWKVLTAHRIILIVMSLSILTNVVISSQGSSTWWSERRAANFMGRIGVTPNVMMSKAIYLADLDQATRSSAVEGSWPHGSYCYDTFQSLVNSSSLDTPYEDTSSTFSTGSSKAVARRLRRTRQRLGSYRHDLLVAMRLVNSVEQEMIQAEWENWLVDENARCDKVGAVLQAWDTTSNAESVSLEKPSKSDSLLKGEGTQKLLQERDSKKRESLKLWYDEYCGSCRQDHSALISERESFSFA